MSETITLLCLFLSSFILISFGFINTFFTKTFNSLVENKYKKSLKRKIKLEFLNSIGIKKEVKLLKIFGVLMFSFGIIFIGVFTGYVLFLKNISKF